MSDWLDLRRDFELWTFNIVDTAIDHENFGNWTKCTFYYAMFRYGLHRLMCLNKPRGARKWNAMVCAYWAQGVALLGGGLIGVSVSLWASA